MNKIVDKYVELTEDEDKDVLKNLNSLTSGLEDEINFSYLYNTKKDKQFRCILKDNTKIYFNKENNNDNVMIQAFIILGENSYINVFKKVINKDVNKKILDYYNNEIRIINGRIEKDGNVYYFEKKDDKLLVKYFSKDTLKKLDMTGIMPYPDKVKEIDIFDMNVFALANFIMKDMDIILNIESEHVKKKK